MIQLDVMLVKGNYTLSAFLTSANGPFTIVLKNVVAKGNATVAVERDGKVRTQDVVMDLGFADMTMDFQNLGIKSSNWHSNFIQQIHYNLFHSMQALWEAFFNRLSIMHQIWCSIQ